MCRMSVTHHLGSLSCQRHRAESSNRDGKDQDFGTAQADIAAKGKTGRIKTLEQPKPFSGSI
jgi:hypothetical protein